MRRLALTALLAALAGCASPDPTYYTLAEVPGATSSVPDAVHSIELRRPGIAGYLDRAEIVRSSAGYRLDVVSNERWGEPFGDMLGRVLAQDLAQRLPGVAVFTEAGALSADADLLVELDVQRFDVDADGNATLLAQIALSHGRTHANLRTRALRLTTPAPHGTTGQAQAMSTALGQLADQIAALAR